MTVCQVDPHEARLDEAMSALAEHVHGSGSELVLLPEMPFSPWLAATLPADAERWRRAVAMHEQWIGRLGRLGAAVVIGTRPIVDPVGSRRNEAFLWSPEQQEGVAIRQKHYLPDEEGYWEHTWYDRGARDFPTVRAGSAVVGVQICTELWFLEHARHYASDRVDMLLVPRATPRSTIDKWLVGGRAAAVCAGAYCLSSNLVEPPGGRGADLGGVGWVIDPEGEVLATTNEEEPFATVDLDLSYARDSKATYPRYVSE